MLGLYNYMSLYILILKIKTLSNEKGWVSLVSQLVKNLPVMQETLVRFLGLDNPLEKG